MAGDHRNGCSEHTPFVLIWMIWFKPHQDLTSLLHTHYTIYNQNIIHIHLKPVCTVMWEKEKTCCFNLIDFEVRIPLRTLRTGLIPCLSIFGRLHINSPHRLFHFPRAKLYIWSAIDDWNLEKNASTLGEALRGATAYYKSRLTTPKSQAKPQKFSLPINYKCCCAAWDEDFVLTRDNQVDIRFDGKSMYTCLRSLHPGSICSLGRPLREVNIAKCNEINKRLLLERQREG